MQNDRDELQTSSWVYTEKKLKSLFFLDMYPIQFQEKVRKGNLAAVDSNDHWKPKTSSIIYRNNFHYQIKARIPSNSLNEIATASLAEQHVNPSSYMRCV